MFDGELMIFVNNNVKKIVGSLFEDVKYFLRKLLVVEGVCKMC